MEDKLNVFEKRKESQRGVTGWFEVNENDVDHMLWPQSPIQLSML